MRVPMVRPLLALLALGLLPVPPVVADSALSLLKAGSDHYRARRYDEAMQEYEVLVEVAPCAASHYNLGVAAFKAGKKGVARLHLERALLHAPRDPDVRANLEFVKASLPPPPPAPEEDLVTRWANAILDRISLRESALTFLLFTWILGIPVAVALARPRGRRRPVLLTALAALPLWLLSFAIFGAKTYQVEVIQHGIILAGKVDVRTGPDPGETRRFELHEGDRVQIVHRSGDWYRIALETGENGWIEARSIEPVRSH